MILANDKGLEFLGPIINSPEIECHNELAFEFKKFRETQRELPRTQMPDINLRILSVFSSATTGPACAAYGVAMARIRRATTAKIVFISREER